MNLPPEHEKLQAAKDGDATQALGEFLHEFLDSKGIRLAEHVCRKLLYPSSWPDHACGDDCEMSDLLYPISRSLQSLMYEFFGIDAFAIEVEKDMMLTKARELGLMEQQGQS